jgi:hypothetical protein
MSMGDKMEMEQREEKDLNDAVTLVGAVWAGINWTKRRISPDIYEWYMNRIKAATYTTSLAAFYDELLRKADSTPRKKDDEEVVRVLRSGRDSSILSILRDKTSLVVIKMRLANEARKREEEEEEQAERMGSINQGGGE